MRPFTDPGIVRSAAEAVVTRIQEIVRAGERCKIQ
jgi:hypothetical protein